MVIERSQGLDQSELEGWKLRVDSGFGIPDREETAETEPLPEMVPDEVVEAAKAPIADGNANDDSDMPDFLKSDEPKKEDKEEEFDELFGENTQTEAPAKSPDDDQLDDFLKSLG